MPLLLTVSCSSKSRLVLTFLVLPFWHLLTRVVPDIFQKSSKTVVCKTVVCVDIWRDLYPAPFSNESQVWYASVDPSSALMCRISSWSVYSVALKWWKAPNFVIFRTWHSVMSPVGDSRRKLNAVAQLQTFPYPLHSFNGFFPGQPGYVGTKKVNHLDFTEARDDG